MWRSDGFDPGASLCCIADCGDRQRLIARKKYIYLCTNALELKRRLPEFTPSKYLTFSVHLDGQREHHDFQSAAKVVGTLRLRNQRGGEARIPRNDQRDVLRWDDPNGVRGFLMK